MLVIETNISYDNGEFKDHQNRIIEVDSWEEYVDNFEKRFSKNYAGTMWGRNFRNSELIENLKYDNFHLSCDLINDRYKTKKLAYLLDEHYTLKLEI